VTGQRTDLGIFACRWRGKKVYIALKRAKCARCGSQVQKGQYYAPAPHSGPRGGFRARCLPCEAETAGALEK
jgi:hypothetical protein